MHDPSGHPIPSRESMCSFRDAVLSYPGQLMRFYVEKERLLRTVSEASMSGTIKVLLENELRMHKRTARRFAEHMTDAREINHLIISHQAIEEHDSKSEHALKHAVGAQLELGPPLGHLYHRMTRQLVDQHRMIEEGSSRSFVDHARFTRLLRTERSILHHLQRVSESFARSLDEQIEAYATPIVADHLETDRDGTVRTIMKHAKTTMVTRSGYLAICPRCLAPDSKLVHDQSDHVYRCEKCSATIPEHEYDTVARLENTRGVLIDFNVRKDVFGHLVLDHHDGLDRGNMLVTATTQVIEYIKTIQRHTGLARLRLLRAYHDRIMEYTENSRLLLYANHLDLDMFLAHFAFRNPLTALRYEQTLVRLSRYGDLTKIDPKVRHYYLIIQGYFEHLRTQLPQSDAAIIEILVKELRSILAHPGRYVRFEREELFRLQTSKSRLRELSEHFRPIAGYERILLEYVSTARDIRIDAIYEVLMERKGGALNNPLIINLPLIVRTNPDHTSFNLAVNPNRDGFEKLDLTVFREPLERAESDAIERARDEIKPLLERIEAKRSELRELEQTHELQALKRIRGTLATASPDEIARTLDHLIETYPHIAQNEDDLRTIRSTLISMRDSLARGAGDTKAVRSSLFNSYRTIEMLAFRRIPEQIKTLEADLKKHRSPDELDRRSRYNREHTTWRIKPNLIIINPKRPTLLSYDEILDVIKHHLSQLPL